RFGLLLRPRPALPVREGDVGPLGREGFHQRPPQAASTAGHGRDLSPEPRVAHAADGDLPKPRDYSSKTSARSPLAWRAPASAALWDHAPRSRWGTKGGRA